MAGIGHLNNNPGHYYESMFDGIRPCSATARANTIQRLSKR